MAWTQTQLDALETAIAEGVLTVRYQDKQVTYRSLDEMIRVRNLMRESLGIVTRSSVEVKPEFSKGLE